MMYNHTIIKSNRNFSKIFITNMNFYYREKGFYNDISGTISLEKNHTCRYDQLY